MNQDLQKPTPEDGERIAPVTFRTSARAPGRGSGWSARLWILAGTATLAAVLLLTAVWFVFTARQVSLVISPAPDSAVVKGSLLTPRLGDHYLMRPGNYRLFAEKACYTPLAASFIVNKAPAQRFSFELEKSPGKLSIQVYEKGKETGKRIPARLLIDGQAAGPAPLTGKEIAPGRHTLEVRSDLYQPYRDDITVEGCGEEQQIQVALLPAWAQVRIRSIPEGQVSIDNQVVGQTPLEINLPAGPHDLYIQAHGRKPWQQQFTVTAGEPVEFDDIRLLPADGRLFVTSTPTGATLMVGDRFAGQTPLEIELAPDREHLLRLSKAGHAKTQRTVTIASNTQKTIHVSLKTETGVVAFDVQPEGASLWIDGRKMGPVPERLSLPALSHEVAFRLEGYVEYRTRVTPRPGLEQQVRAVLKPLGTTVTPDRKEYRTGNGYPLVLIRPQPFTMGSSRREQGRRANETLRKVRLKRAFLMGVREITNREFREFQKAHNSGAFKAHSLNRDEQPVVQVTWQQAARFCNWLSAKDNLPKAYVQRGEKLVAVNPLPVGYRLPTEAEWEYCARFDGRSAVARYPWGSTFPPKKKSGNFADESAKNLFSRYIEGYNDGYAATAPPSRFQANALGLSDLGGNVAEWCHDVYFIYSSNSGKVYVDPAGPVEGELWIFKGSGWKDSSISELRTAFRGYGNEKRDDVGFRVCRYAQ